MIGTVKGNVIVNVKGNGYVNVNDKAVNHENENDCLCCGEHHLSETVDQGEEKLSESIWTSCWRVRS